MRHLSTCLCTCRGRPSLICNPAVLHAQTLFRPAFLPFCLRSPADGAAALPGGHAPKALRAPLRCLKKCTSGIQGPGVVCQRRGLAGGPRACCPSSCEPCRLCFQGRMQGVGVTAQQAFQSLAWELDSLGQRVARAWRIQDQHWHAWCLDMTASQEGHGICGRIHGPGKLRQSCEDPMVASGLPHAMVGLRLLIEGAQCVA